MKLSGKTYWVLLAAVAGLPLMASPAHAQQRVGNDGHALDANPRVGSGGINVTSAAPTPNLGNNIVTDNTTGLYGFHGRVGYSDPYGFGGNRAGAGISAFNGVSVGVPGAGAAANYGVGPQVYYNSANTAAPPPGYVSNNLNTGFIPATIAPPSVSDLRLGQSPLDSSITTLPLQGELLLPGPVDPTAGRTMIQASPLYGVKVWQTNANGDLFDSQTQAPTGPDQKALMDENQILLIRRQLNQTLAPDNSNSSNSLSKPLAPVTPDNSGALPPLGTDNNGLTSSNVSPTAGGVSTGQSNRQYLPPLPQAKQSAQYAQLRALLDQYDSNTTMSAEQANRKYNATLALMRSMQAQPGLVKPGMLPNPAMEPGGGLTAKDATPLHPLKIPTLSKGVASSALADLLTLAEDQIRRGKYDDAIKTYNEATKAAPNNPLIVIGRAHAELAGSYYKQAETDIRSAIGQDKALLMAQFNLNDLFGARFEHVVTQLKQIASDSPKDSTPLFLLAYLSYNADSPGKALLYLNAADKINGENDQIINLMKNYWTLDEKGPAAQPAPTTQPSK